MMVWDPALEKYLAFGSLKTAALDKIYDENSPRPCCEWLPRPQSLTLLVKVFDILYLNDKCLTGIRLSERKKLLRSGRVFKDIDAHKGRLEFVDEAVGSNGKDIRAMLERVLEQK
jgi:DNA ligase-4